MRFNFSMIAAILVAIFPAIASAEGAAPSPGGLGGIEQFIFLGGFVVIFYFLMWRPQSKRAKEHRDLIGGLGKGDEVIIGGGIAGKIKNVKDDFIVVEIADNVEIKVQKGAVSSALPKGTLKDI